MKIGNLECYGIIYKIENTVNHKVYIGQTTRGFNERYCAEGKGIERVYNYHKQRKKYLQPYNEHLLNSIEKYGFKAFKVDEMFDIAFSEKELNKLEYMYIKIYNLTNNKYGYNNKDGGDCYKKNKRTLLKQHKISCTPIYSITDKIVFETENEAINFYKLNSKNIILNSIKNNRPLNINGKKIMFEKLDFYNCISYKRKGIICLNDNNIFGSLREATEYYNYKSTNIIKRRCDGKFKKIKDGRFFMYVNDYYDKLKDVTSDKNKKYIFNEYYNYKNDIYKNVKNLKEKKKIFLSQGYIINIILNMCKKYDIEYIKKYITDTYKVDFKISNKDIINIKNK